MSTTITTSGCYMYSCTWTFEWTVEIPFICRHRRSNSFSFKGCEVHLEFYLNHSGNYCVELKAPPSFPSCEVGDINVRVQTKYKESVPLPNNRGIHRDNGNRFWLYSKAQILAAHPDFFEDGVVTFLVCDVDLPKATIPQKEKSVQTSEYFNDVSSLESLSADLSAMLQDHQGDSAPDVELKCRNQTKDHTREEPHILRVHKNVLCSRSKVLSAMLQSDLTEGRTRQIEIKNMECEVFDQFVRYLYAGKLSHLNVDTARGLYEAADQFEVSSLMRRCSNFLGENLTTENACEILVLADGHSDQEFKESVIEYILKKEITLQDDHWLPFHVNYPKLSSEVLYRYCKQLKTLSSC